MQRTSVTILLIVAIQTVAGCDSRAGLPSAPSGIPSPSLVLKGFRDPRSGFVTSNVRDADGQIIQFNSANELIWPDGTRLPGYSPMGNAIPAEAACACWLVVRFGSADGERRAYLTADYVHDNPGTLVDLEISDGLLLVRRTSIFAPGTRTLSGVITELTSTGPTPVDDAGVWRMNEERTGWQVARTNSQGFYELRGQYDGTDEIAVIKDGYETARSMVTINGDTRFDCQLVRR